MLFFIMCVSSHFCVCVSLLVHPDFVPFKKSVGLMARQKKLIGGGIHSDGVALGQFSWVMKFGVIWVGHFSQVE